ncbi:Major facilitator superfamily general substrate transporter protein [Rutstroemia sp. NJR-2017a WRK4]|nr:Major facilitator superfamily general substrate transporter protein [Rutstroemia sp. NJR-2017a WRK4]
MSNTTTQTTLLQGWTDSPDHRGTMDIIYSCTFTIFICIWSVLCVNVGPHGESTWTKVYRKLKLAGLCILGPDFLLFLTIGQWESARKSCHNFEERGIRKWSMTHAFYADMGGFILRTKDGVTWPLDANEILYLIDEEWIQEPVISKQLVIDKSEIDDRNKKNALVRVYAIVQILWFLINCTVREVQRLAITTLELTTIGFIITTIGVSLLWLNKPTDIETRRVIELDVTMAEIYARAGLSDWYDTPLDFLKLERTYTEVAWRYCLDILSAVFLIRDNPARPIRYRRDDNFPPTSYIGMGIVVVSGFLSWGTNLLAWNFDFPSPSERQAWRASSCILIAVILIGGIYHEILLNVFPDVKKNACERFAGNKRSGAIYKPGGNSRGKRLLLRLSNISPNADPSLTMPLKVLLPALLCGAAYVVSRVYILLEDVLAFRGQNPDVYKTSNWVDFLPHV